MDNALPWICSFSKDYHYRYELGIDKYPLVGCIALNPSTARPGFPDQTIIKVNLIAKANGFQGWIMYNLYPECTKDPSRLNTRLNDKVAKENFNSIRKSIQQHNIKTIWLAWGAQVMIRPYLRHCYIQLMKKLQDLGLNYVRSGDLTIEGHPRHPLYQKSTNQFTPFPLTDHFQG